MCTRVNFSQSLYRVNVHYCAVRVSQEIGLQWFMHQNDMTPLLPVLHCLQGNAFDFSSFFHGYWNFLHCKNCENVSFIMENGPSNVTQLLITFGTNAICTVLSSSIVVDLCCVLVKCNHIWCGMVHNMSATFQTRWCRLQLPQVCITADCSYLLFLSSRFPLSNGWLMTCHFNHQFFCNATQSVLVSPVLYLCNLAFHSVVNMGHCC